MSDDFAKLLEGETLPETIKKIREGLKAPKDSGEYRYAKFALMRMFGPGSIAVGISLVTIVLLFTLAAGQVITGDREIEVQVMTAETVKLDDIKIEEIKPEEVEVTDQVVDMPVVVPGPPSEYSTPSEVPGVGVDGDMDTPMVAFAPVMTKSPLVFKGLYGNRTKGGRGKALASYGGSGVTETSVLKALRWLKDHQKADGSWEGNANACTGLALLTFLAHGETPSSPEFGPTVQKAIQWLVAKQGANGSFSGSTYEHGIATYAISEAYAMTKIMPVKDAMEKAIQIIIDGQETTGGFDYSYGNSDRWDMSCCGWQFQALKAAKMAGATNEKLEDAIKKSVKFLKEWAFSGSGWGYSGSQKAPGGGTSATMTGAGCLALQLLGAPKSSQVKTAIGWLEAGAGTPTWPKDDKGAGVYGWYYVTQAKFQEGGKTWDSWNRQLIASELPRAQKTDGHWEGGDHDPGGHVYTTTLCALMLQVYYRYLPTYKKVEETATETVASDDMAVKVL